MNAEGHYRMARRYSTATLACNVFAVGQYLIFVFGVAAICLIIAVNRISANYSAHAEITSRAGGRGSKPVELS